MIYYNENGQELERWEFIQKRGCCESCGSIKNLTVHHCLFPDHKIRGKKLKELQYVFNLMVLCSHCHIDKRKYTGYKDRCLFWVIQCQRYGIEKMLEWYRSVPLAGKTRYDLVDVNEIKAKFANQ